MSNTIQVPSTGIKFNFLNTARQTVGPWRTCKEQTYWMWGSIAVFKNERTGFHSGEVEGALDEHSPTLLVTRPNTVADRMIKLAPILGEYDLAAVQNFNGFSAIYLGPKWVNSSPQLSLTLTLIRGMIQMGDATANSVKDLASLIKAIRMNGGTDGGHLNGNTEKMLNGTAQACKHGWKTASFVKDIYTQNQERGQIHWWGISAYHETEKMGKISEADWDKYYPKAAPVVHPRNHWGGRSILVDREME